MKRTLTLPDILGNSAADVATAIAIAAGLLVLAALLVGLARRRLRDAATTDSKYDDVVLDLVQRTRMFLLVVPAVHAGARALVLTPDVTSLLTTLMRLSLIAQFALWAAAVIDFFLRRYHRRRSESDPAAITTIRAFRIAAVAAVWVVAVLVALGELGIEITPLVTGLGIGGVAVALATQNILGDLFASLSIVVDKPFVVGDTIAAGTDIGTVERIGLKTTRVRSVGGEQLVFSNADLLQSRIRNYKRMAERRVVFRIGVVYRTPAGTLERIPAIVRGIIEDQANTRFDRAHFAAFGASACEFEFVYWFLSAEYAAHMDAQQAIYLAIVRAFEREGIEFAYPTQTIVIERDQARGELPREG